jgi:hypothetical protein
MPSTAPQIRSRKPTGAVPWPFVLLEGEEKSGKTWAAYQLSASPRIGQTYVLDLGEGSADEYGAIPDVRYEILIHDGSWAQILEQVEAVRAEARRANAAGEPPVVLVIDTMTNEWEGLKDWASGRATERARIKGRKIDPDKGVKITGDLWNDTNARHGRLITMLLTFPGIVVATARGKVVAKIGDDGQPVEGVKEYKVEGQKNLAYDASLWVRMSRTERPLVVGCRSVQHGIKPGYDEPLRIDERPANLVDWLIFDVLGCDPRTAKVRDIHSTTGGALTAEEAGVDPAQVKRDEILALVAEMRWVPRDIAARFTKAHGSDIGSTGDLDALTEFLGELRQDAAFERDQAAGAAQLKSVPA